MPASLSRTPAISNYFSIPLRVRDSGVLLTVINKGHKSEMRNMNFQQSSDETCTSILLVSFHISPSHYLQQNRTDGNSHSHGPICSTLLSLDISSFTLYSCILRGCVLSIPFFGFFGPNDSTKPQHSSATAECQKD